MTNINFDIKLVKRAELENPMSKEQFDANYQTIMDTFKQLQPIAGFIESDEEGYSLNTDVLNTVISELPVVKNTGLNSSILDSVSVSKDTENNTVSLTHNIMGSAWITNIISILSQVGVTDLSNGIYVYTEFKAKTMLPKSTSIAIVDGYVGFTIKTSTESESEFGYDIDIKNAGVISANAVNATLSSSSVNTDNEIVVVLTDVNNFDDVVEGNVNGYATHSMFNSVLTQDTIPAEKSNSGSGSASSSSSSDGSSSGSSDSSSSGSSSSEG